MHPPEVQAQAMELIAAGLNDCEIARRMGIPRATIRDWRRPTYTPRPNSPWNGEICPRCWRPAKPIRFTEEDYAELLGFYLGDGCISEHPRTQRLRIALDTKYPGIIESARSLLARCFPRNPVDVVPFHDGACVSVSSYSRHLGCVLPQAAAGRKHEREIRLEPWQQTILDREPWAFIRACIWTDGCAFINRTGPYEYLSYDFCNMSADIVDLFVGACDRVGVRTRPTRDSRGAWHVRINQRPSVALMKEHVGRKR